jgi:hypothetical protein
MATTDWVCNGWKVETQAGQQVYARGVTKPGFHTNSHGLMGGLSTFDAPAAEAELAAMESWNITVVRLLDCVHYWVDDTSGHQAVIQSVVQLADDHNLQVIYTPWCVEPGAQASPLPWPPHIPDASVIADAAAYSAYLVDVASVLCQEPNVLIEAYAAPGVGGNEYDYYHDATLRGTYITMCDAAVAGMRSLGADHPFIAQWGGGIWYDAGTPANSVGFSWMGSDTVTDSANNVIYAAHLYEWSGVGTDEATMLSQLQAADVDTVQETWDKPCFIGEIGAYNTSSGNTWLDQALNVLDGLSLGYAVWQWHVP